MGTGGGSTSGRLAAVWLALLVVSQSPALRAADILIADRLNSNVYRYSETGTLLNAVLPAPGENDPLQLSQAVGLALSPDLKHLYVSSYLNARVLRYDYDYANGTASNGIIFADSADGLASPNSILIDEDDGTVYVSNLGRTGVARFHPNGSSAGSPLSFAPPFQTSETLLSGLAWAPDGDLLVGSFQNYPQGTMGAVGRRDGASAAFGMFVPQNPALRGGSGVLVHDNFVYVTGMFAGTIRRFHLADGSSDASFGVNDLKFPQALMESPDGNGFFAGILGQGPGQGRIAHYDFDGALIGDGIFALPGEPGGFNEATALITVRLPGDFNRDDIVDLDDLNDPVDGWKARFGQDLDGDDYLTWQRFLGASLGPAAKPVPEPSSLSMAMVMLMGAARWRFKSAA